MMLVDCLEHDKETYGLAVQAALDRLLASSAVKLSERNRRFLAFVVAETLAGRGERIKAYSIGVDVFGRGDDFDPGTDPIVRIEATRLRTALSNFYDGPGASEAVKIRMPPGNYMPVFEMLSLSAPQPLGNGVRAPLWPAPIVVNNQTDLDDKRAVQRGKVWVASAVKRLKERGWTVIVMPAPERRAAARSVGTLLRHPNGACALDLAVRSMSEGRRYSWCLSDLRSGEVRCSDYLDRPDEGMPRAEMIDELADLAVDSVAAAIAPRADPQDA